MTRLVLGIETSCDETAAAVYQAGKGVLGSALFSQIALHKNFGGVVPEIASRSQLEKIRAYRTRSIDQATYSFECDIDIIAVTSINRDCPDRYWWEFALQRQWHGPIRNI